MDSKTSGQGASRTELRPDSVLKTRACSNCARVKMKCEWPMKGSQSAELCTRCSRMKLTCQVPSLVPRRKRGKGKVNQLEAKIDGLVSLLAAGQHLQTKALSPLTPESQGSAQASSQFSREDILGGSIRPIAQASPRQMDPVGDGNDRTVVFDMIPEFRLTNTQAQTYLDVFRREYAPRSPFVIISPQMTPYELFNNEVCLFWAVMATVAPTSPDDQMLVKAKVREYIADHVVVKREKKLGNLQAILVYLAWSEFHIFFESNATTLLSIAYSLVIDLKLDKSPKSMVLQPNTLLRDAWDHFNHPSFRLRPELSPHEKRALLGYYHSAALNVAFYRRGQAPPWTTHYAQCCESLNTIAELETDRHIVAIINIQRVVDKGLTNLALSSIGSEGAYSAALELAINNIRQDVDNVMSILPESLRNDRIINLYKHSLLLRLYEPIFVMSPGSITSAADPYGQGSMSRTDCFWKALKSAAAFFGSMVELPASELTFVPSTFIALYGFTNVTTSRILTADPTSDWDPALARQTFDLVRYLERLSEVYGKADRLAEENGWKVRVLDNGVPAFAKFSTKLLWVSQWYVNKISPGKQSQRQQQFIERRDAQLSSAADRGDEGAGLPEETDQCWADVAFEAAWQDLMNFQNPGMFENFGFDAF